jgi:hypothetical protein
MEIRSLSYMIKNQRLEAAAMPIIIKKKTAKPILDLAKSLTLILLSINHLT